MRDIEITLKEMGQQPSTKYVENLDPAILLIGQGYTVQEYQRFPHPVEGYLPEPIILVGFPHHSLTKLDPCAGKFDLLAYKNGRISVATGEDSETKWLSPHGALAPYLEQEDLSAAPMPLTRYGDGSALELTIGLATVDNSKDDDQYTVKSPSDIAELIPEVVRVKFPHKWEKDGSFYGDNVVVWTPQGTYTITAQCLQGSECEILKEMFYSALNKTQDPGLRGQINNSLGKLINYM